MFGQRDADSGEPVHGATGWTTVTKFPKQAFPAQLREETALEQRPLDSSPLDEYDLFVPSFSDLEEHEQEMTDNEPSLADAARTLDNTPVAGLSTV